MTTITMSVFLKNKNKQKPVWMNRDDTANQILPWNKIQEIQLQCALSVWGRELSDSIRTMALVDQWERNTDQRVGDPSWRYVKCVMLPIVPQPLNDGWLWLTASKVGNVWIVALMITPQLPAPPPHRPRTLSSRRSAFVWGDSVKYFNAYSLDLMPARQWQDYY